MTTKILIEKWMKGLAKTTTSPKESYGSINKKILENVVVEVSAEHQMIWTTTKYSIQIVCFEKREEEGWFFLRELSDDFLEKPVNGRFLIKKDDFSKLCDKGGRFILTDEHEQGCRITGTAKDGSDVEVEIEKIETQNMLRRALSGAGKIDDIWKSWYYEVSGKTSEELFDTLKCTKKTMKSEFREYTVCFFPNSSRISVINVCQESEPVATVRMQAKRRTDDCEPIFIKATELLKAYEASKKSDIGKGMCLAKNHLAFVNFGTKELDKWSAFVSFPLNLGQEDFDRAECACKAYRKIIYRSIEGITLAKTDAHYIVTAPQLILDFMGDEMREIKAVYYDSAYYMPINGDNLNKLANIIGADDVTDDDVTDDDVTDDDVTGKES